MAIWTSLPSGSTGASRTAEGSCSTALPSKPSRWSQQLTSRSSGPRRRTGPETTTPWGYLSEIDTPLKVFCDTKRNGKEWDGSCRYSFTWTDSAAVCNVETQERILLITPSRIEGKSQVIDYSALRQTPPTCPSAGAEWQDFALIPVAP